MRALSYGCITCYTTKFGNKANVLEMVLQIEGFSILGSFDCPPAGLCTCEFMLQNLVS